MLNLFVPKFNCTLWFPISGKLFHNPGNGHFQWSISLGKIKFMHHRAGKNIIPWLSIQSFIWADLWSNLSSQNIISHVREFHPFTFWCYNLCKRAVAGDYNLMWNQHPKYLIFKTKIQIMTFLATLSFFTIVVIETLKKHFKKKIFSPIHGNFSRFHINFSALTYNHMEPSF